MMAGLLDNTEALLALGSGLLGSRGSFGQGLSQAVPGMMGVLQRQRQEQRQATQDERLQAMQAIQMQAAQQQLAEQQRAAAERQKQQEWLRNLPSPQMQAGQAALAGGGGPTVANAARLPAVDPMEQMAFGAVQQGLMPLSSYIASKQKDDTPMIVPKGGRLATKSGRELFHNPEAPAADKDIERLKLIYGDGTPEYFNALRGLGSKMTTHAPAASLSVNTGQKGLDNTLKLRGDFRSEPVYKAHQEMQSAYSQIGQALKQSSPIGDMAAATKIMKLLDPGSVVRESELGMAMAASGLMDRVTNYAHRIVSGEKLTPQQRKDFAVLAGALYSTSEQQYNAKRGEYENISSRNGLNTLDVVGPASNVQLGADGWSIKLKSGGQ